MGIFNKYRFGFVFVILITVIVHISGLYPLFAKEYSPVQAKLMAKRAAKLDALRKLTELIYGTWIDSETPVRDMVVASDKINSRLSALIRGAVEVDHKFYEDLSAEVTIEIETGTVTDILGAKVQYDGKTFRVTGYGSPPHIELKQDKTSTEYGTGADKHEKPTSRPTTSAASEKIVSKNIGKDTQRPGQDKIEQEQVVSEPPDLSTPTVSILSPEKKEMSVSEDHIMVKAEAISHNNEPITDIWVQVNGRRLDNKERGIGIMNKDSRKIDGPHAEIDVTVYLSEKDSHIEVIASNANGESAPGTIDVIWQGFGTEYSNEDVFKPDLYVLSIGVSNYKDKEYGLDKLDYAHEDASAISMAFDRQSGWLYKNVHKRLLINDGANRVRILEGLNWVLKEATQRDTTVIFVAGHGINDERGNYYFLPYDGNPEKPWENGVKWFDFHDTITSLSSKVVLMVDTCHSGGVTGKRRGVVADITDILQQLVNTGGGVVVMAASTGKESSRESPEWGHGAFTKALLEGLGLEEGKADADYDDNKAFSIKELDLFITRRVKEMTDGAQHTTTEIPKTLPDFTLAIKQNIE